MAYDCLEQLDFPSACQLSGGITGDIWMHPVTKAVYTWSETKESWMMLSDPGARMFTGVEDPGINVSLRAGDMWWDENLLELRVWHLPPVEKDDTGAPIIRPGIWVSSTNPQMSGMDTERNEIIGTVYVNSPTDVGDIFEDVTYSFEAYRNGGADDSKVTYQWTASPPSISYPDASGNEQEYVIFFSNGGVGKIVDVVFPEGTYVTDGANQVTYNVYCTVTANNPETFSNASQRSRNIVCAPLPASAPILNTLTITGDDVTLETIVGSESYGDVYGSYPTFSVDKVSDEIFFVVDTNWSGHNMVVFSKTPWVSDPDYLPDEASEGLTSYYPLNYGGADDANETGYKVNVGGVSALHIWTVGNEANQITLNIN